MTSSISKAPPTVLDYWRVVFRYRYMIVGIVCVAVLSTGLISKFILPKTYEAKTTLLPVEDTPLGGGFSFGGGGGGKDGKGGGGGMSMAMEALSGRSGGPTKIDILMALLNSRLMLETVIAQLNLMDVYQTGSKEIAVGTLRGQVTVKQSANKAIEIMVSDTDAKLAADIANAIVAHLDRLNKEMAVTSTRRNRMFIEARLAEKAKKLDEAENALKTFQTEHHLLDPLEQATGGVGVAADLHAQIVSLEVELAALREYATPSHPEAIGIEAQIQELRRQLNKLEREQAREVGEKRPKAALSKKVFPAFEDAPRLALDLLRLHRQVKVEETVYGMLVGMLEQARVAEAKDLPTVQPLDVAIPPEFPSKPHTLQNIQVAAAVALVLGCLLALLMDYLARLKQAEIVAQRFEQEPCRADGSSNGEGNGSPAHLEPDPAVGSVRLPF